jgi:hypothetical protein
MSDLGRAVFLSYASQDADSARRICEALRAGGIEVWFDQSELRGGDAWDQRIRQQIRECALFVPIISVNTQSRLEGYFRREWRLGVDRTLDMADGKPFLVPVAIDDTPDKNAHVPEAFRAVQWTRLPAGDTAPQFVQRVSKLLSGESPVPTIPGGGTRQAAPIFRKPRASPLFRIVRVALILAAIYFAYGLFRAANEEEAAPPAPPASPGTAEKAVLPDEAAGK